MFDSDDLIGWSFGVLGGMLMLMFAGLLAWGVIDGVQDYRSYAAQAECRKQGLEPMRRNMSTTVTCVRQNGYRADSLNVKIAQ